MAAIAALLAVLVLAMTTQGQQVGAVLTGRVRAALDLSASSMPTGPPTIDIHQVPGWEQIKEIKFTP